MKMSIWKIASIVLISGLSTVGSADAQSLGGTPGTTVSCTTACITTPNTDGSFRTQDCCGGQVYIHVVREP